MALAWTLGATLPLVALARRRSRGGERSRGTGAERGQATVEFTALLLVAALVLGALAALGPRLDGRSFGGFLAFRVACAVKRDCDRGDRLLARAYGRRDAALVRELAPNLVYEPGERQLPVDWRHCRRHACAEARDGRDLDVHRTESGERATAFTRLVRKAGRAYVQYWLYFPDSKTTWAGSEEAWEMAWVAPRLMGAVDRTPRYPGFHADDWEAYAVRLEPGGRALARASSHGRWRSCGGCAHDWTGRTGWTRVSRGSHAGEIPVRHELRAGARRVFARPLPGPGTPRPRSVRIPLLPGHDLDERTTTSEGLRLIPLETLDARDYRPRDDGIRPPWQKDAYWDPESDES